MTIHLEDKEIDDVIDTFMALWKVEVHKIAAVKQKYECTKNLQNLYVVFKMFLTEGAKELQYSGVHKYELFMGKLLMLTGKTDFREATNAELVKALAVTFLDFQDVLN